MSPRGYAPLGIGLGRFLTCGQIQLVRRSCSRDDVFGGLRSSIRLGGSKPYRAGSYRLTPASTGRRGKHVIVPGNRVWFAKAQKNSYQKGEGCLGLGE